MHYRIHTSQTLAFAPASLVVIATTTTSAVWSGGSFGGGGVVYMCMLFIIYACQRAINVCLGVCVCVYSCLRRKSATADVAAAAAAAVVVDVSSQMVRR